MDMSRREFAALAASAFVGCAAPRAGSPVPRIRKLGTIDIFIVETSPVVFKGKPWLMEYIRWKTPQKRYRTNDTGLSYLRFRDLDDLTTFTPPFGHDLHLASAFVKNDRVYVTGSRRGGRDSWGGDGILMTESDDLVNWTKPRTILSDPGWEVYNTSVCEADGRFVMVFEMMKPAEEVGVPFTMFFAESDDLVNWRRIPGAVFGKEFYTGAPLLRYHAGWFYFFFLERAIVYGHLEFRTRIARSRDLKKWTVSPRVVLDYGDDRFIHPDAPLNAAERAEVLAARNVNASDLDMCEYGGKLLCSYSWGDQHGKEYLSLGEVDATEREFCESFFN